jgi:hypothetical protein
MHVGPTAGDALGHAASLLANALPNTYWLLCALSTLGVLAGGNRCDACDDLQVLYWVLLSRGKSLQQQLLLLMLMLLAVFDAPVLAPIVSICGSCGRQQPIASLGLNAGCV